MPRNNAASGYTVYRAGSGGRPAESPDAVNHSNVFVFCVYDGTWRGHVAQPTHTAFSCPQCDLWQYAAPFCGPDVQYSVGAGRWYATSVYLPHNRRRSTCHCSRRQHSASSQAGSTLHTAHRLGVWHVHSLHQRLHAAPMAEPVTAEHHRLALALALATQCRQRRNGRMAPRGELAAPMLETAMGAATALTN